MVALIRNMYHFSVTSNYTFTKSPLCQEQNHPSVGSGKLFCGQPVAHGRFSGVKKYYYHSQKVLHTRKLSKKRGEAWGKRGGSVGEAWGKLGEAGVFSGEAHFLTLANAVFWGEAIGPSTPFKILN